jgi:hypothetical protein
MKDKLLSFISYSVLAYALVSTAWTSIPELQALFPEYTSQISAWISVPVAVVGAVALRVQSFLSKARSTDLQVFDGLKESYESVKQSYSDMQLATKQTINDLTSKYDTLKSSYDNMKKATDELIKLVKVDLQAKLSNPLIDEKVKELIDEVL